MMARTRHSWRIRWELLLPARPRECRLQRQSLTAGALAAPLPCAAGTPALKGAGADAAGDFADCSATKGTATGAPEPMSRRSSSFEAGTLAAGTELAAAAAGHAL